MMTAGVYLFRLSLNPHNRHAGTDRKAVHDALSAAGVWVAAADVSAQLEQLLQPAAKRRLRELPGVAPALWGGA